MDFYEQYAMKLLGGIPAGNVFGMPVFIDPCIPNDRIRFVDPVSGRYTDLLLPSDTNEPPKRSQ